ncbi:biotin/lipoyl-containing protein, partial [Nocardiopsis coralliicola]
MSGPGEGAAQQGAGAPVRELVFALPDLGEGLTEAEVVAWRVAPGDRIAVDAPVAEVETAKAAVEVPCPFAGTVTALHADEGAAVPVGAPLVSVAVPDGPQHGPGTGRSGKGAAPPPAGSGAVLVGYGTGGADRPAGRRRRGARAGTTVSPPAPRSPGPAVPGSAAARDRAGNG